jgi:hypothetical protein
MSVRFSKRSLNHNSSFRKYWFMTTEYGCWVDKRCSFPWSTQRIYTVDHKILIKKLFIYGIRNKSLDWFKSYLHNRKPFCVVNNATSYTKKVSCGVPQGSNLGSLLFLLYVNDLPNCMDNSHAAMYADDTNITVRSSPSRRREAPCEGTNSLRLFTPGETKALAKSKVHLSQAWVTNGVGWVVILTDLKNMADCHE